LIEEKEKEEIKSSQKKIWIYGMRKN